MRNPFKRKPRPEYQPKWGDSNNPIVEFPTKAENAIGEEWGDTPSSRFTLTGDLSPISLSLPLGASRA